MPQIYATPAGPGLLVRTEERKGEQGYLFAVVSDLQRTIATAWYSEMPSEFKLVHDPGARVEANALAGENGALIREKAILLECMSAALGMLDERSAEQVRDIYRNKIASLDVVSLTKPTDLVGAAKESNANDNAGPC